MYSKRANAMENVVAIIYCQTLSAEVYNFCTRTNKDCSYI